MLLGPEYKSLPPSSWGLSSEKFLANSPRLDQFQTPILALDARALAHNASIMARWLSARGLEIAPHGKTTMAPQLWQQLLVAGAWGITLATPWQVQLARSHGIQRILLANQMVDPVALQWLAVELEDPRFEFCCWVDSVMGVRVMQDALEGVFLPRPIDVLVELGGVDGRAGVRTAPEGLDVVAAVRGSSELRLAGVAGWEGSLGNDRSAGTEARVTGLLNSMVALTDAIDWDHRVPIVSVGGSAYFELVAERLSVLAGRATIVLRSGAYQVHDDGFYLGISPFAGSDHEFRSAMHGWSRVLSRPEPRLAILDGGKRDFPADIGLPTAQLVFGEGAAESARALAGSEIVKLDDQHAYLRIAADADLPVGAVLRLGLSHPCTAFDKWRLIPVVEEGADFGATVVDLVRTYF